MRRKPPPGRPSYFDLLKKKYPEIAGDDVSDDVAPSTAAPPHPVAGRRPAPARRSALPLVAALFALAAAAVGVVMSLSPSGRAASPPTDRRDVATVDLPRPPSTPEPTESPGEDTAVASEAEPWWEELLAEPEPPPEREPPPRRPGSSTETAAGRRAASPSVTAVRRAAIRPPEEPAREAVAPELEAERPEPSTAAEPPPPPPPVARRLPPSPSRGAEPEGRRSGESRSETESRPEIESEPEPLPVGGEVAPPVKLVTPLPDYTNEAWAAGIRGDVVMRATIDEHGEVVAVEVLHGLPHGLTEAAVDAVRRWKFRPATRRGEPVAVYHHLSLRFTL